LITLNLVVDCIAHETRKVTGLAVWLMFEGVLKAAHLRRERKTKEVTTGE